MAHGACFNDPRPDHPRPYFGHRPMARVYAWIALALEAGGLASLPCAARQRSLRGYRGDCERHGAILPGPGLVVVAGQRTRQPGFRPLVGDHAAEGHSEENG